jgi:hypothetical protein
MTASQKLPAQRVRSAHRTLPRGKRLPLPISVRRTANPHTSMSSGTVGVTSITEAAAPFRTHDEPRPPKRCADTRRGEVRPEGLWNHDLTVPNGAIVIAVSVFPNNGLDSIVSTQAVCRNSQSFLGLSVVSYSFAAAAVKLPKPPPASERCRGRDGTTKITGARRRQPAVASASHHRG